jgi:hypothetical protein
MKRALVFVLALTAGTAAGQTQPKDKGAPSGLKPGADLPGPLYPYNVTGPFKGHFHDLVADYGLEPTVLIIARGLNQDPAFAKLLTALDNAIEKNPATRLHAFVVFLSDDLPDVVANDDKREELAAKIGDLGKSLKHVVLCLDSKKDLEKYDLGDAAVTVILYNKLKIVAVHSLAKGKLDDQTMNQILTEVAEKLGAKRK